MNNKLNIITILLLLCSFGCGQGLPQDSSAYKTITVSNSIDLARDIETIAIAFDKFSSIDGITKDNVSVYSFESKKLMISQVLELDGKTELLFQDSFDAKETKKYAILAQPDGIARPKSELSTFVEFYPKRDDDLAWENDKMAARMYGRGLEWETISCGVDLWCKEVSRPILAQKYDEYINKKMSYHESRGIGGDYYKVGPTLGCGGTTIFKDGKLYMPDHNFSSYEILANGPIRSVFTMNYDSWNAGGINVSAVIKITVDLGSYLCKVDAVYKSDQKKLPVAAGIITRETGGELASSNSEGWLGYWQPKEGFGTICCGIVTPSYTKVKTELAQSHALFISQIESGKPFTYYTGGTWDRAGQIKDFSSWKEYLQKSKQQIDTPLVIKY